jgi:hypothetical protein
VRPPGSRHEEITCMPGSQTPWGPLTARDNAVNGVAFREYDRVGTPIERISRLNGRPACTLNPTLRCALTGRQRMARAGVTRSR